VVVDHQTEIELLRARLPPVVSAMLGESDGDIEDLVALSGGSSRDTWSFRVSFPSRRVENLILQRRRRGVIDSGLPVETEAELLRSARSAGAPVARLIGADAGSDDLGAPFLLVERIEGETVPQRILRSPEFSRARSRLAGQYGAALARLHQIPVDGVPGLMEEDPMDRYRRVFDEIELPHPAIELGFRWLDQHRPPPGGRVLVHGDFRNGNGIVNGDGLSAVIDFELAHWGDPLEDIGWFCIRAWRFGELPQAGGYGSIPDFLKGYVENGGVPIDRQALHWWMVLGTVRWAVMCLMQGVTHTSGYRRSVELAAVGRRTCEPEFDLMLLLP
jgi:aminoglycoside phosphotransferase (APT) family kinase protein